MTKLTQLIEPTAVRERLLADFTEETLRDLFLCTEHIALKPLLHEFSSDDDLENMVEKALAYCEPRSLLPDLLQAAERGSGRPAPTESAGTCGRYASLAPSSLCPRWLTSRSDMQGSLRLLVIGLYPSVGLALAMVTGWLGPELTLGHVALAVCVYPCWAVVLIGPADVLRWLRRQPPRPCSDERRRRMLYRDVALLIGLLWALVRLGYALNDGAPGDFSWALVTAADLLEGRDPYDFGPSGRYIPYPLPVALFGLPLLVMPIVLAAMVFVGSSSALLAYGILRKDKGWRLLIFMTPAFLLAVNWAQWSPLIAASWFIPILAPLLVLIKPQIALPVAANRLTWRGLFLAFIVLLVSIMIYPQWPIRWSRMLVDYQRIIPILGLPLGPLLLLSALFPRSPRARLLMFMSVLPVKAVYDLVPLYIVPNSGLQMAVLVALTWLDPIGRLSSGASYDWEQVTNAHHFYALCILMYSHRDSILSAWLRVKAAPRRFDRTNPRSSHDQQ